MRSELVNDVVVRELLVQPWRLMVEKRAEDTGGGPKPKLRVYVEGVQWSLGPPAPINKSNESSALQSGTPMERLLIYSI